MTDIIKHDLTAELWREYQFNDVTYRIDNPVAFYRVAGSTMHRIQDSDGIMHCIPAPGTGNCVMRWKPKDIDNPVQF